MEVKKELNSQPLPQRNNQNVAVGAAAAITAAVKPQPAVAQNKQIVENASVAKTNSIDTKPNLNNFNKNQNANNNQNMNGPKRNNIGNNNANNTNINANNNRFGNRGNGRGGRRNDNDNRSNDRRGNNQGGGGQQNRNNNQNQNNTNNSNENVNDANPQQSNHQHDGMRRPFGNRDGRRGEDFMIQQRLKQLQGPTHELPPIEHNEVKFSGRNRLYVGNLPQDVKEEDLREWFKPFGEVNEAFVNNEKNFAFLKVDYHANAERAKRELDGSIHKNRPIRIRFAPNATTIRVKNLTPFVTNELLHKAFEIFGSIERAVIVVDDRGKPTGEGIVEYQRKSGAMIALRYCTEKCYFLTSSLRPCVVELFEHSDDTDGYPEKAVNRKTDAYMDARQYGPRFAEQNSFQHEYGTRWKNLHELYKQKFDALKREMLVDEEKLEAQMEYARYEHETEMLREQLRAREMDREQRKSEWEMKERYAEEQRKNTEEQLKRSQEDMNERITRQDDELRRRQQENTLFMQAQQLMMDAQDMGGDNGNSNNANNQMNNQNNQNNHGHNNRKNFNKNFDNNGGGGGGGGGRNFGGNNNNQDAGFMDNGGNNTNNNNNNNNNHRGNPNNRQFNNNNDNDNYQQPQNKPFNKGNRGHGNMGGGNRGGNNRNNNMQQQWNDNRNDNFQNKRRRF